MVLFSVLCVVIIIVPNNDIHRNKLLNLNYNNFLYTGRLFESPPQIFRLVQWEGHILLASTLSAYVWIYSTNDKPLGQQITNKIYLKHSRCWKWPIFLCTHSLHLCEMYLVFCSFDVTYQEPHRNSRASPFWHLKNEYEGATYNIAQDTTSNWITLTGFYIYICMNFSVILVSAFYKKFVTQIF
jgi:hypothetical protein